MGFVGNFLLLSVLPLSIVADNRFEQFVLSGPSRVNRQAAGGGQIISGQECISKCFEMMEQATKKNLPNFDIEKKSSDIFEFFNGSLSSNLFDTFCTKIYQPISDCTKKCPIDTKNTATEALLKSYSFFEYVCVRNYKGVKDNLPCLQKVYNQSRTDCKSQYDYFTITQAKNQQQKSQPDQQRFTIVDEECKSIDGLYQCTRKVTEKICNADTVNIITEFNRLSMDQAESLLKVVNVTLPASCKQIGLDLGTSTNAPGEVTTKAATNIFMSSIVFVLAIVFGVVF